MYFSAKLESSFYFSATWNVNCALINCYGYLILGGNNGVANLQEA